MAKMTSTDELLPSDDLTRALGFAQADGETVPHIGLVGAGCPRSEISHGSGCPMSRFGTWVLSEQPKARGFPHR